MENLSIDFKNFECPLCFELFKDPIQIPCPNQHVICKMCCDKLFEVTEIEEGSSVGKCYCRSKVIVENCVPAKAIARIISNKYTLSVSNIFTKLIITGENYL